MVAYSHATCARACFCLSDSALLAAPQSSRHQAGGAPTSRQAGSGVSHFKLSPESLFLAGRAHRACRTLRSWAALRSRCSASGAKTGFARAQTSGWTSASAQTVLCHADRLHFLTCGCLAERAHHKRWQPQSLRCVRATCSKTARLFLAALPIMLDVTIADTEIVASPCAQTLAMHSGCMLHRTYAQRSYCHSPKLRPARNRVWFWRPQLVQCTQIKLLLLRSSCR